LQFVAGCAFAQVLQAHAADAEITPWPQRLPAPALDADDLSGHRWQLDALRGRAVVVNFWASWCEPCRAEMPALQQAAEFYGAERLAVLAVNFKESAATATRFARQTGLALPVLLDREGEAAKRWGVRVFPTTVLVHADGKPRWRVRGPLDWTSLEAGRLVEGLFLARS